jgi:hypothetical protein
MFRLLLLLMRVNSVQTSFVKKIDTPFLCLLCLVALMSSIPPEIWDIIIRFGLSSILADYNKEIAVPIAVEFLCSQRLVCQQFYNIVSGFVGGIAGDAIFRKLLQILEIPFDVNRFITSKNQLQIMITPYSLVINIAHSQHRHLPSNNIFMSIYPYDTIQSLVINLSKNYSLPIMHEIDKLEFNGSYGLFNCTIDYKKYKNHALFQVLECLEMCTYSKLYIKYT